MNDFLRATFNCQKFQGLFINTALGNFTGYVAGSLVTLVSTRRAVERRAIGNLFGILPRKKIIVHVVPHWLEWLLELILGFLVMEAVRYWFNHRKYADVAQRVAARDPITNPFGPVGSPAANAPPIAFNVRARYEWTFNDYNAQLTPDGQR